VVAHFDDDAFRIAGEDIRLVRFGAEHTTTALYFSFVTLTTLGYGDITPVSTAARMLATIQAVIGQMYLTVLVARFVGMHISQAGERRRNDEWPPPGPSDMP
jgi:Na+/H+-dicarboxylate symporter